ncbi:MAG TPA: oxidoreductase, partial [Gemmatimonadales bacterium]|nr:oxidoreductase [Gemmatimonadales bacterium]
MVPPTTDDAFLAELRAAVAVLERIVADRTLLAGLPSEDLTRLLQAAGHVYAPDAASRRQLVRATARRRKAEKVKREETIRDRTGIRTLRRRSVVTTPNVFPPLPPEAFEPADLHDADASREPGERRHCYVCKEHFVALHHFYDQLCPPCAELNFRKRTELADLRGTVSLLTGGRVKIGYQA